MQLLYGNDGINYRTIDKSPEMTDGVEKAVLGTYSKYEFVSNPYKYTEEPETVTYVTSNLDRQLPADRVVVCKTGHIRKFSSPSYYLHCLVKEVPEDFYEEQFFEIFNYRFVSDHDIDQYQNESIDSYRFTSETMDVDSLTEDQLIVILASFMSNENRGQKTKILADASGDAYNRRSREILASLYRYLPPALRKAYGFKTYCQDGKNLPARVAFVVFNRDEAKDTTGCITLKETPEEIRNSIEEKYIEYAAYLVKGLDEKGRKEHFEVLKKLEKNGWLSIEECVLYYTKMRKWENGTQEELLPEWIQYVDQNSFMKGPLYEKILEIIVSKVTNAYYNTYLFDKVLKLFHESIYHLSPAAAKTIRFADCLDEIYIMPDRFQEWYLSQLRPKMEAAKENGHVSVAALKQIYQEEIETLKSIDIMSKELKELLDQEIRALTVKLQECDDILTEQQDEELQTISRMIADLEHASIEEFCDNIAMIWNNIHYPENRNNLVSTIEEWVDTHVPKKIVSEKEAETYIRLLSQLQDKLSTQKYQDYIRMFDRERERLEEEKKSRSFKIAEEAVLHSYCSLILLLDKDILQSDDEVRVRIGTREAAMRASSLKKVLGFILEPEAGRKPSSRILHRLMENTRVLHAEHLSYLLEEELEEQDIEDIVDYYLAEEYPAKVSGRYVAKMIKERYSQDTVKALRRAYKEEEEGELAAFYDELSVKQKDSYKREKEEEESSYSATKTEKKGKFGLFGGKW